MKLTREKAWQIHRESASKLASGALALELARVSFAVGLKENRSLDTDARNPSSTARGLMQMLKGTQCEIAKKMIKEPCVLDAIFEARTAVRYAQTYLLYQYKRYKGDWHKAVHAYNQGSYVPTRKKAFASGEAYANSAMAFYSSSDYAALDSAIGITNSGVDAATRSTTYSGWS